MNIRLDTTGGEGDPLEIEREVEIWRYEQMVYAQPRICLEEWDAQSSPGFWNTNGSPNLGQTTSRQKKEL